MKKNFLFLISLSFVAGLYGQNIYTKAGNGGNPGDYLSATNASIAYPTGVTVDMNGNIYIADQTNNRIRKVNAANGQITTVAGTGTAGFTGDGAAAVYAQLRSPWGVAVDGSGNIYIADEFNHRIRKVSSVNGQITTIAGTGSGGFSGDGGLATAAQLNYPNGLTVDASGNIYIADYFNNRVRKINASDGKINTIAGTGTNNFGGDGGLATLAQLNSPTDVAVDGSGNVFIADKSNNRIRKVNASDGKINTVAGNGTSGYTGDGLAATSAGLNQPLGVAVDMNGNIFIADNGNSAIRKVNSLGIISTYAGTGVFGYSGDGLQATSAQLNSPHQVAVDATGNIFIDDYYNYRIRKVNTLGVINTVAGNGTVTGAGQNSLATTAQFNNPTGVAADGSGNIFIADFNNSRIDKVNVSDGTISTVAGKGDGGIGGFGGDGSLATTALLSHPTGVVIDINGNFFIADRYNHRIRKVTAATGIITTVAGNGATNNVNGGSFGGDGGLATAALLNNPYGLAVDANGNIFIADDYNHRVRKVNAITGIITTIAGTGVGGYSGDAGPATAAKINFPTGVALDAAGNIYISDAGNNRVRKVNIADGTISTIAGTGVAGYSGDGGNATSATLNAPEGITLDASGNIYVSEFGSNAVRKILAATNIISTVAGVGFGISGFNGDGGSGVSAYLYNPIGIAVDGNNTLYIADAGNNRIRYVCPNNNLQPVNGSDSLTAYPENKFQSVGFKNNCGLIAKILLNGSSPVVGIIKSKVWIDGSVLTYNSQPFVQRHYEIAPQTNASTSTAGITLFFTQAEFSAYNASPLVVGGTYAKLPVDAADAANYKANLLITKKDGVSNDGTGVPGSYTGGTTTITPASVSWNSTNNWWEVVINVTGFSGFFAQTPASALPLRWISVDAILNAQSEAQVSWKVQEENVVKYEVEKSVNATQFLPISTLSSLGDGTHDYVYTEPGILHGAAYYRIKQTDRDGQFAYSKVLTLKNIKSGLWALFPNPSHNFLNVKGGLVITELQVVNLAGQVVKKWNNLSGNSILDISSLASGVYTIRILDDDGIQIRKWVRE